MGEHTLPDAADLPKILTELSSLRVSHVLDVKVEGGSFALSENPPGLTLVFQRDSQRVYRVD